MKIICYTVFLLYVIGLITDLFFLPFNYAIRFTAVGFLVTVGFNIGRMEHDPEGKYPISPLSQLVIIFSVIVFAIFFFIVPSIMGVSEGIAVRETALLFETAPFSVKYKDKEIVDVPAKVFLIKAYSTSLCAHVFFICTSVFAWEKANSDSARRKKLKV